MEMFEKANILKLRFATERGLVTAEDLRDMPLTSTSGFCLDSVAKLISRELKESTEESFVSISRTDSVNELRLEIVKHIIAAKILHNAEKKDAAEAAIKKKLIKQIISKKKNEALDNLSIEDLEKMEKDL